MEKKIRLREITGLAQDAATENCSEGDRNWTCLPPQESVLKVYVLFSLQWGLSELFVTTNDNMNKKIDITDYEND